MHRWLNEPHVVEFYSRRPSSYEEVRRRYLPRLDPDWLTKCFIVAVEKEIGYIQVYRNSDYPEWAGLIGEQAGISLDLFIGELDHVGIGLGRLLLSQFLDEVAFPLYSAEEACYIAHQTVNHRALRASQAAGFQFVREFLEEGLPNILLKKNRTPEGIEPQASVGTAQ